MSIYYQNDQYNGTDWIDPWLPARTVVRRRRWGGLVPAGLVLAALTVQGQVASTGPEGVAPHQWALLVTDLVLLGLAAWGVVRCLRAPAVTEVRSVGAALNLAVMVPFVLLGCLAFVTIFFIWLAPFIWAVSVPAVLRSLFVLLGRTPISAWDAAAPFGLALVGSTALLVIAIAGDHDELPTVRVALLLLTFVAGTAIALVASVACLVDAGRGGRRRDTF